MPNFQSQVDWTFKTNFVIRLLHQTVLGHLWGHLGPFEVKFKFSFESSYTQFLPNLSKSQSTNSHLTLGGSGKNTRFSIFVVNLCNFFSIFCLFYVGNGGEVITCFTKSGRIRQLRKNEIFLLLENLSQKTLSRENKNKFLIFNSRNVQKWRYLSKLIKTG